MKKKGTISTIVAILMWTYIFACYGEAIAKADTRPDEYSKWNIAYYVLNSEKGAK